MNQSPATIGFSVQELLEALKESLLLSSDDFDQAAKSAADPAMDAPALAQSLINNGILTEYQMDVVCKRDFGQLRIGNYEVLDRIGAGGMGAVFKARHRRMKRIVALKVLTLKLTNDESNVRRFQREVEAIARLSHPNIVMAHDADEAEVGHFLVMEFVNGRDLASEVAKNGPLPIRKSIECVLQAARAMEYAHGQGIIHRDIKPANLLQDVNGVVKVTDLGLARFNDQFEQPAKEASALTQAGTIMGTVDFMSPEQAMGQTNIDHRADIYSLGCTLYFLLIGAPPYQGPTLMATLVQHREAPIPSLRNALNTVPVELDTVFRRMVAKTPTDRYQSMAEVIAALESAEANLGEESESVAPETGLTSEKPSTINSTGYWERQTIAATPLGEMAQTVDVRSLGTPANLCQKVLLVEPSRTQSAIIRKYLQTYAIEEIIAVASGQEALEATRRENPGAIVSALHLPDMTGVQLAQKVREELKAAAPGFVLISSQADSSEAGSLSNCGKAVILQKPFTPEKLIEALRLVTAGQSATSSTIQCGQLRVLIVDDSAPARRHVRGVLKELGLSQFTEAADGAQAVAAVAGGTFDLIVTDYNMPLMDGRGLVGYLRQNPATASVPIIMVTTETDPAKLEAVRQLGVTVCDKTFPSQVVEHVLGDLMGAS